MFLLEKCPNLLIFRWKSQYADTHLWWNFNSDCLYDWLCLIIKSFVSFMNFGNFEIDFEQSNFDDINY